MAAGYSIDSRTMRVGEVFFAIRGERFDGHDYVLSALGGGALAAVVSRDVYPRFSEPFRAKLLPVDDTVQALQILGNAVRHRWGKKIIAVTGSTGKTTTKEMIARVLGSRFRVFKTEGNLNNHYGLPLSLLRLTPAHEVAVLEMGMNHAGEIAKLASIACPQVGVFTNVAAVHLEFFESVDAIAAAKHELVEGLPPNGVVIANADDPRIVHFGDSFKGRTLLYGRAAAPSSNGTRRSALTIAVHDIALRGAEGSEFEAVCSAPPERAHVRLPLLGEHNVSNAAAALTAGVLFGVTLQQAARVLETMSPTGSRGRVLHVGGVTVIDDSYNSNPRALEHMLAVLSGMEGKRHIAVVGEMLELGPAAEELHRQAGAAIAGANVDALFAVRGCARQYIEGAHRAGFTRPAFFFDDSESCGEALAEFLQPGDVVLFKASRGVALEKALDRLRIPAAQPH